MAESVYRVTEVIGVSTESWRVRLDSFKYEAGD